VNAVRTFVDAHEKNNLNPDYDTIFVILMMQNDVNYLCAERLNIQNVQSMRLDLKNAITTFFIFAPPFFSQSLTHLFLHQFFPQV